MDTSLGKRCRESDDLFNFKNSNGIIRLQASITKKYPIISNKIFDYIDINSIKFNNIDYIKSYYIIFYIIILSELAESCFYTKDSLDNILKYFLEYIEQYEINLFEITSFKSLMNILKLDDFWNLSSSEKKIIYNFIFPILITPTEKINETNCLAISHHSLSDFRQKLILFINLKTIFQIVF